MFSTNPGKYGLEKKPDLDTFDVISNEEVSVTDVLKDLPTNNVTLIIVKYLHITSLWNYIDILLLFILNDIDILLISWS